MNNIHIGDAIPFIRSGSYPARAGNLIRPLVDGKPAFRRICEAIEAAHYSVWGTVAFLWASFEMPDYRGSLFDLLDRAAARGVDVRLIFWRPDEETARWKRNAFWGSPEHFALLEDRKFAVHIRWDRAHPGYCQHQKSWIVDAGEDTETAFVGGINLNPNSVVMPGHLGEGQNHDVYVELAGPSAVDVHHNFVQRWNEASEQAAPDGRWGAHSGHDLLFPVRLPAIRGAATAQVQRTIPAGRYTNGHPSPNSLPFDVAAGERSNFDQYCAAINAAQRSIYIENQAVDVSEIIQCLRSALERGVEVLLVMPSEPDSYAVTPEREAFLKERASLGNFSNFTLAGIAGLGSDNRRKPVWVHDKLMLVDDVWATIGSCNLHHASLFGNAEMNVAFYEPEVVRTLRYELFKEHLDRDTAELDDRAALQLFRSIATKNRQKLDLNDMAWQGIAFTLDLSTYGRRPV